MGGDDMSTIKDVARLAGVAVGTVSRYLNGAEVKQVNKIKIEESIQVLNFRINPIARTLKTNRTNTIGIVIQDLSDLYSTTIIKSVEKELYKQGYNIFVCDAWGDKELEIEKISLLLEKMVDGLIVYPCSSNLEYLNNLINRECPVVTIDLKAEGYECDQVFSDNTSSTYNAVQWLINNNHKRIGLISGNPGYFTGGERLKGYKRALEDYSIPEESEFIKITNFTEEQGYSALKDLMELEEKPTAIIASNYYTTIGAVKAVYDLGIKIPEELSLIGFDNLGLTELVRPSLSIIVQPMEEVGRSAAQLLLRRIKGDYEGYPHTSRLKTDLVLRDSTRRL
jgi:LacI family transcriptional regulator